MDKSDIKNSDVMRGSAGNTPFAPTQASEFATDPCIKMRQPSGGPEHQALSFTCTKCSVPKSLSEFDRNNSKRSGHDSRCKKCVSDVKSKSYRKKIRERKLRTKFSSIVLGAASDHVLEEAGKIIGLAAKEAIRNER